jgi:ABC-type sulfate transport system permease subunit
MAEARIRERQGFSLNQCLAGFILAGFAAQGGREGPALAKLMGGKQYRVVWNATPAVIKWFLTYM